MSHNDGLHIESKTSPLNVLEYDFSDVKAGDDLQACNFYEYARESRAAREEVVALRRQPEATTGQLRCGRRVQFLHQSHLLMMLSFCSGFADIWTARVAAIANSSIHKSAVW